MSVNISLGDTPGVSAYFDGQPIQDELEAEVRREEERQEKELRDLLATELEDFEEDFLSDSNSEEDSVNVSRVSRASNNSHRVRQNEQIGALQQASDKLVRLAPDPSGNRQLDDASHVVDLTNDAYYTPISKHRSGPANPQDLLHEHPQNLLRQQHHHKLQSRHPDHHPFRQYNQDSNQNNQGQLVPNLQGHELQGNQLFPPHNEDGDDWMMRVQQTHAVTTSTSSPHPPQPMHRHQQQQQQQQHQFYPPIPHPVKSGMVETPPLSLPNNVHSMQQQALHGPVANSAISKAVLKSSTPILPNATAMDNMGHKTHRVSDNPDDCDNYQVQYKSKSKKNDVNENDFYIQNENVEFFKADGDEEKRSYEQLEVLYRVRGRELEDLRWKLKQAEEEIAKESRMYKHKLALANGDLEGGQESLRQCQTLLQQSKSDLTESQALVRSLEAQVASLKEVKEELIKKLQVAESTIENLSHQCEELQQSESLSRMRNEHENVVASLTQRFERELLSVKEKLDETKSSLEMKHDETVWLKKQLADSTKELEQAQISRGETINRLAKSLEDSQRQCQTLLEQSSSQELASLRVKLQQTTASKSVSEETCLGLQGEIKELKEQLSMFETASALGAVTSTNAGIPSHNKGASTGLDDSMTDLGIKKTLDFDTPSSTPKLADTSSLEELVTSLRSELEKCLHSNRRKRSEIVGKSEEIQLLKEELQLYKIKSQDLEKTCVDQKIKLKDLESLMSNSNGESILEVRLRRDLDALSKEKVLLLEDIEDYKKRVEEVGASEAKLTEINTELSAQIAQMVSDFDSDKATALDRCQRTLEEVHHLSMNNMRAELESRLESEKSMMAECHRMELSRMKDQLNAAQEEAHSLKSLYINTCDEMKKQEEEMRSTIREEVEEELASVSRCKEATKETAMVQEEKDKRLCVEESFAKEKEIWNEKEDLYQKEIKASKDTIAQINKNHERDVSDLQNTISNMRSQHKEDMDVLNEKLTTLTTCHHSEIKKLQEESNKMREMKMHFESQLTLSEKRYTAENQELTSLLQKERCSKLTEPAGRAVFVERKESFAQTDPYSGVCGDGKADGSLMERLEEIQAKLESAQNEHLVALENMRTEHKREFEKAARNREEKFQVELRYFLKDKDDKFKEKLDLALKKCEESAKLEFEKALKEKEVVIEHLKKDLDSTQSMTNNGIDTTVKNSGDKMMTATIEKLNAEKCMMERKLQVLELEKKEELARLQEMHAEQEKALIEKYTSEIEILTLNHSKECDVLHRTIKELEDKHGDWSAGDSTKIEDGVRKVVNARIQEERARWFRDAQEYIKNEIEAGIVEREQHKDSDDAWTRKLNDEVKQSVDAELEKMKNKMESDKEEEVDQRVREHLAQEMNKLEVDREKVEEDKKTIEMKVKQKLSLEIENMKIKFLSELEARVAKEKDQLEQDVKKWKEDMKKKIDGEKKVFVAQITKDMELKVSEERKKVQVEIMHGKQEELRQMRTEMEDEMRKRIEREKMDWQKEEEDWKKRLNEGGRIEDLSAVRNKLRAAEEACNKACTERERAVELLKRRELSYKEDKQKLVAGLKQLRHDLDATKEEQAVLEDKYAQMDRKYKEDMKEAKKKKESALEKLQARCEEEKEKVIVDYKNLIASMKEDFCNQMDRVKSEAEIERATLLNEVRSHTERALTLSPLHEPDTDTTTLFELRDHYLETVTKIKEDVMSHVQAANSRAASTMKSEMRKQRRRLIHMFKERCKASIRSILTGQIPPNVLNSLEHAIDLIAEALVTTPNSTASNTVAGSPATSKNSTPRDDRNKDQTRVSGEKHQAFIAASEREAERDKHPFLSSEDYRDVINNNKEGNHPLKHHPQLAKVDLYDSEAIDSSPQTSHNSSPSSIAFRKKSEICNASKTKSSPPVPRLDFSPFNTPQEAEHPMSTSEGQQRCHQRTDGYLTEVKQNPNRPHSAESRNGPQFQNTSSELQKSCMVKNTDEPSPRDRMKMIEAQVRLANWAASGEMPWKGTSSKHAVSKQTYVDGDEYDKHLFLRPGEEAERFLRAQRTSKKIEGEIITPMKKDRIDRKSVLQSLELDGYVTDDSSVSKGSHSSFVTLEPDANQKSQSNNCQGRNGKGWSIDTMDCNRIKSAVFEHPDRTFVNVTQRREQRLGEGLHAQSNDDARSVGSDSPPNYRGLPTSTPAKRNAEHQRSSKTRNASKSAPDRRQKSKLLSMQNLASDSDDNIEQESQGWKMVNAFSEFPVSRTFHREQDHEKRSNFQPRPSKSQPSKRGQQQADNAKSIDFEFPDISEITQASGDVHTGGGMWRYKSLEDLLPHQAKERGPPNQNRNNPVSAGHERKPLSVAKTAAPIQAMNSDFWREQSLENYDDDDEFGIPNYREHLQSKRTYQQTSTANRSPSKHHSDYDHGRSRNDHFTNSKQINSKHAAESTWNKKQSHKNPINPSHSSSPHPTHSYSRKKTQQNSHIPSYSSHFDAHVDDLRKSLETMEANPFSFVNMHKSKSKMKRSVSEQSLHTIQWDQDKSTDIDDLVTAYTTGGAAMSHFDLHNFGHEEAF